MATGPRPSATPKVVEPLTKRKAWKVLQAHYEEVRELHLRKLFAEDPKRGERMTAEAVGIFLDYSKNRAFGRKSTRCFEGMKLTSRRSAPSCT